MVRQLTTSPDGKIVVFNAAGYLYKNRDAEWPPERVSKGIEFEFEPEFSPDGKFVVCPPGVMKLKEP